MKCLATPLRFLPVPPTEVSLAHVLKCGQSFRWTKAPARATLVPHEEPNMGVKNDMDLDQVLTPQEEWCMGWYDRTVVLRQDRQGIHYRALYPVSSSKAHQLDIKNDTTLDMLKRYLALSEDINLGHLYQTWSNRDVNFAKKTADSRFAGIRVLRQDAFETLVAFICSSNNNISRISLMLSRLCAKFGQPLPSPVNFPTTPSKSTSLEQDEYENVIDTDTDALCYSFPTPQSLTGPNVESTLRELGFGYRAGYVAKTAQMICKLKPDTPEEYLYDLMKLPLEEARTKLLEFCGVGPKVADCILLFGLKFDNVVPVDTHVYQIAVRDYGFKGGNGKSGSQSNDVLKRVSKRLQDVWDTKPGWAHQILFTADLKSFESFVDTLAKPTIVPKPKVKEETEETRSSTTLTTRIKTEEQDVNDNDNDNDSTLPTPSISSSPLSSPNSDLDNKLSTKKRIRDQYEESLTNEYTNLRRSRRRSSRK